jgi:hypothetical protein
MRITLANCTDPPSPAQGNGWHLKEELWDSIEWVAGTSQVSCTD